jgi:phasin family protein
VADTVEKNLTDAAIAVAKTEAAALKAAEAAFAQASDAAVAPMKAVANAAPAPAKATPAKAAGARKTAKAATAKTGTRKVAKKSPARKPAKRAAAAKRAIPITKAPARAAAKAIKTGAKSMNTQTKKAAETAQIAADQIKTVFGDVNQRAKLATDKTAKIVEELAEITRGNVEAMVASSKVAAKGVETMGQGAAAYSRKSFEDASAAFKSFSNVKSATDFFKLQGDFARSAFDSAVAESARVSETVLKLAGDVAEPLTSRYTVAAERVKTIAA